MTLGHEAPRETCWDVDAEAITFDFDGKPSIRNTHENQTHVHPPNMRARRTGSMNSNLDRRMTRRATSGFSAGSHSPRGSSFTGSQSPRAALSPHSAMTSQNWPHLHHRP